MGTPVSLSCVYLSPGSEEVHFVLRKHIKKVGVASSEWMSTHTACAGG